MVSLSNRRTPVVILQAARRAFLQRRGRELEQTAEEMVRHRIDAIALGQPLDVRAATPDAARVSGEHKQLVDIDDRVQPLATKPAVRAAKRLSEQQLLDCRAMRAHQTMAAVRTNGHRRRVWGARR